MKILLIAPKYDFVGYTPTGLASIASVAEEFGHEVSIVDMNIEKLPKDRSFDLVGITGLSLWKNSVIETSKQFNGVPVIVGGPWASLYPYEVLREPSIDYVCVGEGEVTFGEFLKDYPDIEDVQGIGYKTPTSRRDIEADFLHVNPRRPFIDNLDDYLPAWHLLKLQRYKRVSITTSRSCPHKCIFCSVHTLLGRKWRPRSVESVIEEIELLVTYGVKHITFGDDNLNVKPERVEKICEEIIKRRMDVTFDIIQGVRADRLPFRLLDAMMYAGFTEIIIAPESGSQRVLDDVIHKNLDLSCVEPVVEHCKDIGLQCGAFFVIGFPWETMEEIEQTIKLADKLRELECSCYVGNAMPYPDTELYAKAKNEGYLRFDGEELNDMLYYLGKPRKTHCLSSPYWQPEEIVKICEQELKKNLRSVYGRYSFREVASKVMRHPVSSFRKILKVIR